jgi:hypothetical protein
MQTAAAWRVLTVTTEHQCVEQTAADLPQLDPELPSVLIALTWSDKSVGNFVEQDFAHKRRVVGVAHVNPDQFGKRLAVRGADHPGARPEKVPNSLA